MPEKYAIGIDLGGTYLRAGLVSKEGEILRKIRKPSSENFLDSVLEAIEEIICEEIVGIGIGITGLIDRKNGRVYVSPNLHGIEGIDIAREIRRKHNIPVIIENDANVTALGEKLGGAGRGFENIVLLTLGTGIGGGFIYKDRLLNISAEIGHMSINSEGEKCPCGNIGCLENYASARAMVSKALSMLEKGNDSLLKECCEGSFYKLKPEDIYKSALDGDTLSREILRGAGKHLGVGLANIINLMSPDAIILTGGLLGAWNIYIQEAIREASRRSFKDLFNSVKILPSSLGDKAGVIGAACLVFNECSVDDLPTF
jgi:glucokinase